MKYLALCPVFFVLGAVMYSFSVFPFDSQTKMILREHVFGVNLCDGHVENFRFYGESQTSIDKIFVGDSLVALSRSNIFFDSDFVPIGSSGMVNECLPHVADYVLSLHPKKILLYNGGNDADHQGRQTPSESVESLRQFAVSMDGIDVIIHGVNYAHSRDASFVDELNNGYQKIADDLDIQYIPPFDELNFQEGIDNTLTIDGEHLRYKGYVKWFEYMRSMGVDEK